MNITSLKSKKGITLFTLMFLIIFVLVIILASILITKYGFSNIESKEETVFKANIESYKSELMIYTTKYYSSNTSVAVLDGHMIEEVIDVNEYFKNKFTIKSGQIVGIRKNLKQKDIKWLEGYIDIE